MGRWFATLAVSLMMVGTAFAQQSETPPEQPQIYALSETEEARVIELTAKGPDALTPEELVEFMSLYLRDGTLRKTSDAPAVFFRIPGLEPDGNDWSRKVFADVGRLATHSLRFGNLVTAMGACMTEQCQNEFREGKRSGILFYVYEGNELVSVNATVMELPRTLPFDAVSQLALGMTAQTWDPEKRYERRCSELFISAGKGGAFEEGMIYASLIVAPFFAEEAAFGGCLGRIYDTAFFPNKRFSLGSYLVADQVIALLVRMVAVAYDDRIPAVALVSEHRDLMVQVAGEKQ